MLTVQDLHVWFGLPPDRTDAVKAASFNVASGESFGLVGESGSGKSTILRAITGLIGTWSGAITVDGQPVTGQHPARPFTRPCRWCFRIPMPACIRATR